jgi:hypothetical protein
MTKMITMKPPQEGFPPRMVDPLLIPKEIEGVLKQFDDFGLGYELEKKRDSLFGDLFRLAFNETIESLDVQIHTRDSDTGLDLCVSVFDGSEHSMGLYYDFEKLVRANLQASLVLGDEGMIQRMREILDRVEKEELVAPPGVEPG